MKMHAQKIKLLKILEILRLESSKDFPISSVEILSRLESLGISCDRKTLYKDIEELVDFGYDIKTIKKKRNMYYIDSMSFNLAELQLLVDAVSFANFLPQEKAKKLIFKISKLGSEEWSDQLAQRSEELLSRTTNDELYSNIVAINKAIFQRKKISFKYFDYEFDLSITYRKKGEKYILNPVKLVLSDNKYYLIGYDDNHKELSNYRIDRMHEVSISEDVVVLYDNINNFNLDEYLSKQFAMFGGDERRVFLRFHKSITNAMIDKFGQTMKINSVEDEYAVMSAKTDLSDQFYAWLVGLKEKVQIIKPSEVVAGYVAFLQDALDKVNGQ